jgi:hypothetical protein
MDQMNKFGKDSMDVALNSFGAWSKNAQALASEVADYSKKFIRGHRRRLGEAHRREEPGKGHGGAERIPQIVL